MDFGNRRCFIRLISQLLIGVACCAPTVRAEEPFADFLEALRHRQMFDMARAYLEQAKTSTLISAEDKKRIPFEEGRALVEEAAGLRDVAERNKRLDDAEKRFTAFVQANAGDPIAAEASLQLASVLIQRGIALLDTAQRPGQSSKRTTLVDDARRRFEQAQKLCGEVEAKLDAELKQLPKDTEDKQEAAVRDQLRGQLILSRMLAARVVYESNKLYAPDSNESKKSLKSAADKYGDLFIKYKRFPIGLEARVRQGRCLLELGDTENALAAFEEVLSYPDEERLKSWKRQALALAMGTWLTGKEVKVDRAIEAGGAWLAHASPRELHGPDGLTIAWRTAQAYQAQAAAIKDDDKKKGETQRKAARLAAEVARRAGEHQQPARELVAELRKIEATGEPETFGEARAQGKAALDNIALLDQQIKAARSTGQDADQIPAWEEERTTAIETALHNLRLALTLTSEEVSSDDVNEVRYFLAFLDYQRGRAYDAAIVGEFIARKYPGAAIARDSAKVALFAYLQAYNTQAADNRTLELERMADLAEFIGTHWPDQPEAAEAFGILSDIAARSNDVQTAAKYLAKIPADSPARAEADLKQGQALWAHYLTSLQLPEGQRPAAADLEKLQTEAKTLLEEGLTRARAKQQPADLPNYSQLVGELSLAQICNNTGQYAKALELLERPQTGALALVAAKNAIVMRGGFSAQSLTAALRAYVGGQQFERAEKMMDDLNQQYASLPDGTAALTKIYVSLGMELEQQITRLKAENRITDMKQVVDGLQRFMDQIAKRDVSSPSTLNWIGETSYRLGTSRDGERAKSPQAKADFENGAKALEKLLALIEKDPKLASGGNAIRLRIARCHRGAGNYDQAFAQIKGILAGNPNALEAQLEAARTYEFWGEVAPEHFQQAMYGVKANPGDAKAISLWGWNGIARRLQRSPKLKELYEEARYKVADCSYKLALSKNGPDKATALNSAEKLIESNVRLDPSLGGEQWRNKYDALLKDIQRAAGRAAVGLSAFSGGDRSTSTARVRPTSKG